MNSRFASFITAGLVSNTSPTFLCLVVEFVFCSLNTSSQVAFCHSATFAHGEFES